MEAYCMKCKERRSVNDAEPFTMKNGKPAVRGKCAECGTTVSKIGAVPSDG